MQDITSDTHPMRDGEELPEDSLGNYLRSHLPTDITADQPMTLAQFPGGHSNLTYLVQFGDREFVLRRPPVGPVAPTAHDMPREYRMLAAIHPVFPLAPKPYVLCEDTAIIGVPFYLMERRRGIIIRRDLPPEMGDDLSLRRRVSESLIDALADLHTVDIEKNNLMHLGKPVGFVARQVKGWSERWARAKTTEVPEMEHLVEWLRDRMPPDPSRPTLLHNDYKLDNVILDANNPARLVAILDWEMCALGDPLVDLGLLLCYWSQKGDSEARREAISGVTVLPGWFSRAEVVERYAARTGTDVSNITYYEVLALFKLTVVIQQIYYRYFVGQTNDERFAEFGKRVAGLAEAGWELAQTGTTTDHLGLNVAGRHQDMA
ncbi:MAG: phosphotransferase family protein [Acidobacteria bacterium]|nr:phosphotransferase family protein [Acidobacteriota bacterium]